MKRTALLIGLALAVTRIGVPTAWAVNPPCTPGCDPWQCTAGFVADPGTLSKIEEIICVGGSTSLPEVQGEIIINGFKSQRCWDESCNEYYNNDPITYQRAVRWVPPANEFPGTFPNCGTFPYTAYVRGDTDDTTCPADTEEAVVGTFTVKVVAVTDLQPNEGTLIPGSSPAAYLVCVGSGDVIVTATNCPAGIAEADLPGCWSFSGGQPVGLGKYQRKVSKTVPSETTFTCTAGTSSKTIKVIVVKADLISVTFTSDHGVLKNNNSDWTDSGTTYAEPEWVFSSGRNYPISQTKNTAVSVDVEVSVQPAGVPFDIVGSSGANYFSFSRLNTTDQTVSMTSTNLPNSVGMVSGSISWSIKPFGLITCTTGNSGPHTNYVTWGTPTGSVVTEKRMSWVCVKAAGSVSAENCADGIHSALGNVDPPHEPGEKPTLATGWVLLAATGYGECDEQADLMTLALKMLGSTGTLRLVRASLDGGMGNCLNWESRTCPVHGAERLQLDFASGVPPANINAFEGCCETAGYYYAVWPKHKASNDYTMLQSLSTTQRWCYHDPADPVGQFWTPCDQPGSSVPIP